MKALVSILALLLVVFQTHALQNLLNTEFHTCVKCLCHAVSNCYVRQNCAKYSISEEYWSRAGSPQANPNDGDSDPDSGYRKCMLDENCIINTIKAYTESFGETDCTSDGIFDCRDQLALHLFGDSCKVNKMPVYRMKRYNSCASANFIQMFVY